MHLMVPPDVDPALVTGTDDELLRFLESRFAARVTVRGYVGIVGDPTEVRVLTRLFTDLFDAARSGERPTVASVERAIELLREDAFAPHDLRSDVILTYGGHAVCPKTAGQKRYVDAVRANTVTFGIGPAGTGKTYLAMAMAVAALNRREVVIASTRPVVEAGESLGFLPGTLEEKVDPYIRPLYDVLFSMMDRERAKSLLELGTIEIAPLAFMRGRTLSDAFVILDEAQNTTREQMKMFLTRLGVGSTFVVTGDLTQTDLPQGRSSLAGVRSILAGIEGIAFVDLSGADVVRHGLVTRIVAAYDEAERRPGAPPRRRFGDRRRKAGGGRGYLWRGMTSASR